LKVAVSASSGSIDAQVNPTFGRCPYYVIVDTESMAFEAVPNASMGSPSGAGIGAAQVVAGKGVEAVLTGNVGPNATAVLGCSLPGRYQNGDWGSGHRTGGCRCFQERRAPGESCHRIWGELHGRRPWRRPWDGCGAWHGDGPRHGYERRRLVRVPVSDSPYRAACCLCI